MQKVLATDKHSFQLSALQIFSFSARFTPNISNPCRDDERGLTLPEFRRKLAAWQRIVSIAGI
jgi:hypothetical protein